MSSLERLKRIPLHNHEDRNSGGELHAASVVGAAGTGHDTSGGAHNDLSGVMADQHHAQLHAAAHASGGGDAVKLDDLAAPDDNTDLDATTSTHGLLKKLPGGTTTFLRADGTFAAVGADATTVFRGMKAYHSTTQSLGTGSYISLLLDSEDFDTDGYHFTSAANLTGTVAKTASNVTIVGTGTSFTTELSVGQVITIPGTAVEAFVVRSIADNTHFDAWVAPANSASGQTAKRRSEACSIPAGLGGYYFVGGYTNFAASASNVRRIFVTINEVPSEAAGIPTAGAYASIGGGAQDVTPRASSLFSLSQGDYLFLGGFQNSGGALNASNATKSRASTMEVTRLG